MKKQDTSINGAAFTGQWIGETQGCEMPAHLWDITQQGSYLRLRTRWEGESTFMHFYAELVPGEPAFSIGGTRRDFKATLIDKQHFVIPEWCNGSREDWDGESSTYDVIFSRPGIGELTARSAYLKSLEQSKAAEEIANSQAVPPHQTGSDSDQDLPE
jgi:hypothetical protein